MAQFLRDKRISNVTLNEGGLNEIFDTIESRIQTLPTLPHEQKEDFTAFAVIRIDEKGYKVYTREELLRYFRNATMVDRIFVNLQSAAARSSNNSVGSFIDLRFDTFDLQQCYLQVSSHDSDWVEASFSTLDESLRKHKNRNGWSRSQWFDLLLQTTGVLVGFVFSFWAAFVITEDLPVENAFVIAFLFVLLLFSNAWGYGKTLVLRAIDRAFPNIEFDRPDKDKHRWVTQAIISAIVGAIVLYALHVFFTWIHQELSALLPTIS